jgi:hypothetical protein
MKQEIKRHRPEPQLIFSTLFNDDILHDFNNHTDFAHMAKYGRSDENILNRIIGNFNSDPEVFIDYRTPE